MIINIPLNTGLMTHPEPEDIGSGGNSILTDYDIDVPGKLVKREALGDLVTNASIISDKGVSFVHRITTTDPYDTETELFILQKDDKTIVYKTDTAFANQSAIIALPSPYPSLINFLQEGQRLRITAGTEGLPWIYQYIDRNYFWGFYNPSAGYDIQKAYVRLSDTQFIQTAILNANLSSDSYPFSNTSGIGLDLTANTNTDEYYYKVAPVFDGNQIGIQSNVVADTTSLANANFTVPQINFELDSDLFNKRLTGICFYRAKNTPNSIFYKILTVSTLKNDPSLESVNDATLNTQVNFASTSSSSGLKMLYPTGTDRYHTIANHTNNVADITSPPSIFGSLLFIADDSEDILEQDTFNNNYWVISSWGATNNLVGVQNSSYAQNTTTGLGYRLTVNNSSFSSKGTYVKTDGSSTYNVRFIVKTNNLTNGTTNLIEMRHHTTSTPASATPFITIEHSNSIWTVISGSFTATQTDMHLFFTVTGGAGSDYFDVENFLVTKETNVISDRAYCGSKVITSREINLNGIDSKKDKPLYFYNASTILNTTTKERHFVESNSLKAILLKSSSSITGTAKTIHLSDSYFWKFRDTSDSTKIELEMYDTGLFDGATSPIEGVENIDVHYKYGVHLDGRLYVGNVKLDSDGEQELHTDWILFSELNSPDVIPVSNYIKITDMQGGEITGLAKMLGDLVVFMNKGIFRISTPSADPTSWSLVESEQNIGCISSESIVEVEGNIFFAGEDQIYQLDQNFQAIPVSLEIQDTWQGTSNKHLTKGTYDPKKRRIIYQFGGGSNNPYMYYVDMKAWSSYAFKGITADGCLVDKDMNVYVIDKESLSTKFYKLYNVTTSSEAETTPYKKTGFISLTDIGKNTIVRRINIRGKFKGVVRVYKNNSTQKWNSAILDLSATSGKLEQSIKVGMRADSIALELYSNHTLPATNIDISRIEIEVDGG